MASSSQTTLDKFVTISGNPAISLEELMKLEERQSFLNRTCVFKNCLSWQGSPLEMNSKGEDLYFLLRQEAIDLMEYIEGLDQVTPRYVVNYSFSLLRYNQRITDLGKVLFGNVGGTGKSSLLFFIANYCHRKGWVVLYWPQGSNEISKNYVQYFMKDNSNYSFSISSSSYSCQVIELLDALYSEQKFKVLVAIDQWNVFLPNLRSNADANRMYLKYLKTFQSSGALTNGIFIGAMSSQSFFGLPLDVFPDATKQSAGIVISPYNPGEFRAHIDLATHCGLIKENQFTPQQLADFEFETGGIPRLLYWMLSSQGKFKSKVTDYYAQRMKKFIERCELNSPNNNSTGRLLSFQDIAVSVYLNKKLICSETSISPWIELGLLVRIYSEEDSELDCFDAPCPMARNAIYSCLASVQNCTSLVEFLITDKQTKGRALELLFLKPFANATPSSPVSFSLQSINGKTCNIDVQKVVQQKHPHKGIYPLHKITPGTLMICHDDHKLIDFYIYNTDCSHIFIRVSHMSYSEHCAGGTQNLRLLWTDIVKKKRKKPEEKEVRNEENEENEEKEKIDSITISKRMKVENKEPVFVRSYYRLCSSSIETSTLTKKDTIIYLSTSDVTPPKLDKHILICSFEKNASRFSVDPEFIRNSKSEEPSIIVDESNESEGTNEHFQPNKTPKLDW